MFIKTNKKVEIEVVKESPLPIICFEKNALIKMHLYVKECDKEISWLGIVDKKVDGNNTAYIVEDVMLLEQEVTGTTTEMNESALSKFGTKLIEENKTELFSKIKCWGHSHVNMAVYASGTDDDTFEQFYKNNDYFIRLICNKKGDMNVDFMDCSLGIKYLNLPWFTIATPLEEEYNKIKELIENENKNLTANLEEFIKEEIKENIIIPKPVTYVYNKNNNITHYNKTNNYNKNYSYNKDYDYTKDYNYGVSYSPEKEEYAEDAYDIMIPVKDNYKDCVYERIDNILDYSEIEKIFNEDTPISTLRETYKDVIDFNYYVYADWEELKEAVSAYVFLMTSYPDIEEGVV